MKVSILVLFCSLTFTRCFGQFLNKAVDYEIIGGHIYAEKVDNKNNCKDCDLENTIFKVNKKFTYSYKYTDIHKKSFRFKASDNKNWDFVDLSSNEPQTIKTIELIILPGGLRPRNTSFCQTRIGYQLQEKNANFSMTGLIENKMNIWMHPPRDYLFRILELNPFPYIKAPYKIGNEWEWDLKIGSQWGDKRWKEWSGDIINSYHYRISETSVLNSNFGKLACLVIEGLAKSKLGETKLKSYFNKEYGFIRLEYENIDKSTIDFTLEKVDLPSTYNYYDNHKQRQL